MPSPVAASNALTARWAATQQAESTVLSGLGVWPLLALLVDAARGPVQEELRAVVGLDDGAPAAGKLLADLDSAAGIHAALGLWTRHDLPVTDAWLATLPAATHELLSGDLTADKAALDAWAVKHTDGLIPRMPVQLTPQTLLVLASALAVKTTWIQPFRDARTRVEHGPWAGRTIAGLTRTSSTDLNQVGVLAGPEPVTRAIIAGDNDIDVHLLLGKPDRSAGSVLAAGIDAVGTPAASTATTWQSGFEAPGVEVRHSGQLQRDQVAITTCRFSVHASHDLLANAELFGLSAAQDASHGQFPGISPEPLAIGQARQDAMAIFSATGFEAAVVTAIGMRTAAAMRVAGARLVSVRFDRPFGFVAVHRPTGLVLVAGWVTEPGSA